MPLAWSLRLNTGARTRRARSALCLNHRLQSSKIALHRIEGFVFKRQLEDGQRVTPRDAGTLSFVCQASPISRRVPETARQTRHKHLIQR